MGTSVGPSIAFTIVTRRRTPPNKSWHRHNNETLVGHAVILDAQRRDSVERAIRATCQFRKWHLHALNVRTNHVHAVVCIGSLKPERALTAFKANSTKQMRQDGCWPQESTLWAEKGSKRHLWNGVSHRRLSTFCMGKGTNCLTLTIDPVAIAPGTDSIAWIG